MLQPDFGQLASVPIPFVPIKRLQGPGGARKVVQLPDHSRCSPGCSQRAREIAQIEKPAPDASLPGVARTQAAHQALRPETSTQRTVHKKQSTVHSQQSTGTKRYALVRGSRLLSTIDCQLSTWFSRVSRMRRRAWITSSRGTFRLRNRKVSLKSLAGDTKLKQALADVFSG